MVIDLQKCPYGARGFNFTDPRPYIQGINTHSPTRESRVVEKCNFCADLLAEGKPPGCVTACHEKARTFGDPADADSEVRRLLFDQSGTLPISEPSGL